MNGLKKFFDAVNKRINSIDEKSIESIKSYITSQKIIRVYIPASPGTGHQTTTCNIIRRLISFGYENSFQVVYVNKINNANTIKNLLPELNINVKEQDINNDETYTGLGKCQFEFIVKDEQKLPSDVVEFGISGGVDTYSEEPTKFCNVKYFLMLQPFQWNAQNFFYYRKDNTVDKVNLASEEADLGGLEFVGTTCYYMDISMYKDWKNVKDDVNKITLPLDEEKRNERIERIKRIKNAVYAIQQECIQNSKALLLPVYGLSVDGSQCCLQYWQNTQQINALANLLLGVLKFQESNQKSIVVITLDKYSKYNNETWDVVLKRLLPKKYSDRLTCWKDTDKWNDNNNISKLKNDEILVINFPKLLPGRIFNYFYLNSQLPPIFEGKGTTPVMLNSGKPYLQLSKPDNGYEFIYFKEEYKALSGKTGYKISKKIQIFLYPSKLTSWLVIKPNILEIYDDGGNMCINAGNAIVHNKQTTITISKDTFEKESKDDFAQIKQYLGKNKYINDKCNVLDKFKALDEAGDMEGGDNNINKKDIFDKMQTACGQKEENIYKQYRDNIDKLAEFFKNAINKDSKLNKYFKELGDKFHNEANDKLIKGLSYAVAKIEKLKEKQKVK